LHVGSQTERDIPYFFPSFVLGDNINYLGPKFYATHPRDPFAPPPPSKLVSVFRSGDHNGGRGDVSERAMSSLGGGDAAGYDDEDSVETLMFLKAPSTCLSTWNVVKRWGGR